MIKVYEDYKVLKRNGIPLADCKVAHVLKKYAAPFLMEENEAKKGEPHRFYATWEDLARQDNFICFPGIDVNISDTGAVINFRDYLTYHGEKSNLSPIVQAKEDILNLEVVIEYREVKVSLKDIINHRDGELAAQWFRERGIGVYIK